MSNALKGKLHGAILWIFFLTFLVAVASSFYHFLYKKHFPFLVETSCNPQAEQCFSRDCADDPDDCPPDNLDFYKEYTIMASDFAACSGDSCEAECRSGDAKCEPIACDEANGDVCTDAVPQ